MDKRSEGGRGTDADGRAAPRMLAAGCDAYLAKPFHYRERIDSVNRLLG